MLVQISWSPFFSSFFHEDLCGASLCLRWIFLVSGASNLTGRIKNQQATGPLGRDRKVLDVRTCVMAELKKYRCFIKYKLCFFRQAHKSGIL
jgi:hypothetical protein